MPFLKPRYLHLSFLEEGLKNNTGTKGKNGMDFPAQKVAGKLQNRGRLQICWFSVDVRVPFCVEHSFHCVVLINPLDPKSDQH